MTMAMREHELYDDFKPTNSGLWLPGRLPRKYPTALDFFCGAGGFSCGVIQGGFEVLAGFEFDAAAALTYMTNLGSYPIDIHYIEPGDKDRLNKAAEKYCTSKKDGIEQIHASGSGWLSHHPEYPRVKHFWFGDIRKVTGKMILDGLGMKPGDIDLVFGGPPCQGFSTAGQRDIMDPRNSLIFDFAKLIVEIQPKTMMMENVPGILSMVTPEGIPVVDAFCQILEVGGFGGFNALKKTLLNTSGCGAALKSKKVDRRHKAEKEMPKKPEPEVEQMALF